VTDIREGRRPAFAGRFAFLVVLVVIAACAPTKVDHTDPAAALREAAGRGDVAAVRALLEQGAPVDARDDRGAPALVRAAYGNHLDAAALLVRAGADVDLQDDTQQSAYLIATSEVGDDLRLLDLTLDVPDGNGDTALADAERGGQRKVASILRSAGAAG
jgi:hypothetical protein